MQRSSGLCIRRLLGAMACATAVLFCGATRSAAATVLECRGRDHPETLYFTAIVDKNTGSLTVLYESNPLAITNVMVQNSIIEFEFTDRGIHAHRRIWPDGSWNQDVTFNGKLERNADGGHCSSRSTTW